MGCNKIYVIDGIMCTSVVPELCSDQEEAAMKIILHIKRVVKSRVDVFVMSPDSDMAMLLLGHLNIFSVGFFFRSGFKGTVASSTC